MQNGLHISGDKSGHLMAPQGENAGMAVLAIVDDRRKC